MESSKTGSSEVNVKKEIHHPVETCKIVVGGLNYVHTLLEIPKNENLEEVAGINDTIFDCDIGNNEQSTSISEDDELNKQSRENTKSVTRQTRVKHKPTWYKCSSCCYKAKYKSRIKTHFSLKHDDNPVWYQCCFCSYKTKNKQHLLLHFKTQHDTDPIRYQCHLCGFETKYKQWLPRHIKTVHYKSTTCFRSTFCKFRTVRESSLKKHIEQHKLIVCSICEYRTTKKGYLSNHMRLCHSKSPKWYQCEFCRFKTKYEHYLKVHVERKHNQDRIRKEEIEWFYCDSCKFKSTSLWCLELHVKYSHNLADKLDQCEFIMGETTALNNTKEEKCTNKYEFKIDSTSGAYDRDVYKDMIHHIEVKPDLPLNLNDSDAQTDHHIDNYDSTIDLTSNSCENDTQYGQTDFKRDTLQNFTENIVGHEKYINHSVSETEQQHKPYVSLNLDEENFIQQEYSYPLLGGSFKCDFCEFNSSNRWCLDYHSKHTHNLTDDDNLVWYQCCYCSHKTKSRSSLLSHFHTQHDTDPV